MIRKLCSMLLLGGTFLSPAFAQTDEWLVRTNTSRTSVGEISKETTRAATGTEDKENSVLLPELNDKAKISFEPDFTAQPQSDPFKVKPRSFILPVGLMAVGTYSLFNEDFKDVNDFARESMWDRRRREDRGFVLDHPMMFLPFAAYYGLNIAGIKSQHKMVDGTLIWGVK